MWKFLSTGLLRRLFHGAAVGLHDGSLTSAHGAAALLIGEGESTAERDGAEQGAADHVDATALQAELARWLGLRLARSHELAFIEEVGVALVALIEILRCVLRRHLVWILRAAKRDLRRLLVTGIEGLQSLMRRQRTRAGRGCDVRCRRQVIVAGLIIVS